MGQSLETVAGVSTESVSSDRTGCELFDVPDYAPVQCQRRTYVLTPTLSATSPSREASGVSIPI